MTRGARRWTVRLTASAEGDLREVLRWTSANFGEVQARAYAKTLSAALSELAAGPIVPGGRARSDIAKGIFTLHVARPGRKGRHFFMFRIGHAEGREVIEVLRVLHEAMDLPRHLPPADDNR